MEALSDMKTLACGEEQNTTTRAGEECLAVHAAGGQVDDPFGSF